MKALNALGAIVLAVLVCAGGYSMMTAWVQHPTRPSSEDFSIQRIPIASPQTGALSAPAAGTSAAQRKPALDRYCHDDFHPHATYSAGGDLAGCTPLTAQRPPTSDDLTKIAENRAEKSTGITGLPNFDSPEWKRLYAAQQKQLASLQNASDLSTVLSRDEQAKLAELTAEPKPGFFCCP